MLYQAYQGLFSSFVMVVLTAVSAAIAWNYCEPLGWSLGKWNQEYLFYILFFGALIALGGLAKSIMRTKPYVRLAIAAGAVVFLIVVSGQMRMSPESAAGNAYGQSLALIGLFVISLLSLRGIADNAITGNMDFPWQVDRSGGAVLGFFTGLIVVGTVLASWQMMPLGPGLLAGGYQDFYGLKAQKQKRPVEISEARWNRESNLISLSVSEPPKDSWAAYNRYNDKMQLQAAPFPYADSFAIGVVKALSYGSMGSDQNFGSRHEDMLLELWAGRNGISSASRQTAQGDAITSAQWQAKPDVIPLSDIDKKAGVLKLTLDYEARDEDAAIRFKGTQVRLVGTSGRSYWPKAINLEGISWAALYEDISKLKLTTAEGERGYLRYKAADDGNYLWAKDAEVDQDDEYLPMVRREIRIHRKEEALWFQVQLVGASGSLEMVPTSLAVYRKPKKKKEKTTIELIFELDQEDVPSYVVFKRTATKQVRVLEEEKAPAVEEAKAAGVTG